MSFKKKIIIAGPTASGKSSLAINLAIQIDGEIISVDSRQCFNRIDIGTAKPTPEQMREVPHYNISVLPLDQEDTVADFRQRSRSYADDIESRGKRVIYCGGSTLHIQSIFHPLDDVPSGNSENIEELNRLAEKKGVEYLYQKLKEVDPDYAKKMDGLNRQRIIRALDVWNQTGRPFSSFHRDEPFELPENIILFALHHPREILHKRISDRTDRMLKEGLVEETKQLLSEGYSPDLQAFNTVGYKQAIEYLNGELSFEQMVKDIKTATRRYAKRQITWLRRWPFVRWIDMHKKSETGAVEVILQEVAADSNNR